MSSIISCKDVVRDLVSNDIGVIIGVSCTPEDLTISYRIRKTNGIEVHRAPTELELIKAGNYGKGIYK